MEQEPSQLSRLKETLDAAGVRLQRHVRLRPGRGDLGGCLTVAEEGDGVSRDEGHAGIVERRRAAVEMATAARCTGTGS